MAGGPRAEKTGAASGTCSVGFDVGAGNFDACTTAFPVADGVAARFAWRPRGSFDCQHGGTDWWPECGWRVRDSCDVCVAFVCCLRGCLLYFAARLVWSLYWTD